MLVDQSRFRTKPPEKESASAPRSTTTPVAAAEMDAPLRKEGTESPGSRQQPPNTYVHPSCGQGRRKLGAHSFSTETATVFPRHYGHHARTQRAGGNDNEHRCVVVGWEQTIWAHPAEPSHTMADSTTCAGASKFHRVSRPRPPMPRSERRDRVIIGRTPTDKRITSRITLTTDGASCRDASNAR
jgi:hypothetical protein